MIAHNVVSNLAVATTCLLAVLGSVHSAEEAWKSQAPPYYVRGKTWCETMIKSREALARSKVELSVERYGRVKGVFLGPWFAVGPFETPDGSRPFKAEFQPERKTDLGASYGSLRWACRSWRDGDPHELGQKSNVAYYLYRMITAGKRMALKVYLGSDDGIKVWLNGRQLARLTRLQKAMDAAPADHSRPRESQEKGCRGLPHGRLPGGPAWRGSRAARSSRCACSRSTTGTGASRTTRI